jgi:hypothetical protein
MSDYEDNDCGIVDMSKWHVCHDCKSDDYIVSSIPKGHWAYSSFKTTKIDEFKAHKKTQDHIDIVKQKYKDVFCESCNFQCYSKKEFEEHCRKISHKQNAKTNFKCEHCDIEFPYKCHYDTHLKTQKHLDKVEEKEENGYKCEHCNFETPFKSHWEIHIKSNKHNLAIGKLEEKEYYCEECDYRTKYESQWLIHCNTKKHKINIGEIKTFEKPTFYRCECCNYETPIKQVFEKHAESKKHKEKAKE